MKEYLPPYLKSGDKALIISPSGATEDLYIDGAKSVLEQWGLDVNVASHARGKYGRFGGTVEERLYDLQTAMDDRNTKLIFCSRGGYGIVHLLDKLDFTEIRKHPKWLVGYSDITALHLAFLQNGIISLHAPMARHLTEDASDTASFYLKQILFSELPGYTIQSHDLNRMGNTRGRLFGGNLAVLSGLIGTRYMDVPKDGILFIEDIGEAPYKIDRMIWQLKLSGILGKLSGLIVGQFSECNEDPLMGATIYESIKNVVDEYNFPVVFDFPVGHVKNNFPLFHGLKVKLRVEEDKVTLDF